MFTLSLATLTALHMMPYGHCYPWQTDLVVLHVLADALTAIAYYSIPISLLFFVRRRDDLPFNKMFALFGAFVLAGGTAHLMEIWTLWHPDYWTSGTIKAIMALASICAAVTLVPTIREMLKRPDLDDIEAANQQLQQEIEARERVETALAESRAEIDTILERISASAMSRDVKVLIVDDFESDRLSYQRYLKGDEAYDYRFIEAEDSAEGLALAKEHLPDIILLDYCLPDSQGLDTLEALRQQHPGVFPAIIMMTGQGDEEVAVGAIKAGAAEYLVKGKVNRAKLVNTMHRALTQQRLKLELDRSQRRRQLITDSALRIHQSAELQDTLKTAVEDIQQVLNCEGVRVYRVDTDSQTLLSGVVSPLATDSSPDPDDNSIIGGKKPVLISATGSIGAKLSVPIRLSSDTDIDCQCCSSWGTLVASYSPTAKPAPEDIDILLEIAVQLGISIQQMCLLEQLQGELLERCKAEKGLAEAQRSLEQVNQDLEVRIQQRTALLVETNQQLEAEVEQRRHAEAALRESENQLRLFVKYTPAAVAMLDRDLCYQVYSHRWLSDYNLSDRDLIGRSHYEFFPDTPDRWRTNHQRCLAGEVLTCEEDSFVRENGETEWLRWELHPWYTDGGAIGGLIMLTEVITERKRLQEEIAAQQNLLQSFFEAVSCANIGIAILDKDFRYLQINPALADIDTLSPADHLGKRVSDVVPHLAEKTIPIYEQVFQGGAAIQQELAFCTPWEPEVVRHWLGFYFPISDASGATAQLGMLTIDITQKKCSEEQLEKLNEELKRSNKELEHFAYVASHDLREPLRKIRSYSDLLVKRYEGQLDERADKYIGYITDGAMRMMNLINDLLEYSRVGRGELKSKPVALGPLLDQVLSDLQTYIEENQAEIDSPSSLPLVQGNAIQLRQLLQNLIGNSLKYRSDDSPKIVIEAAPAGEFWQFSVSDNGIGIAPEFAERIFVVFQRLHVREAYEGTGIGLAVCKRIVEHHGGQIWVESTLGEGATFYFTLPAVPARHVVDPEARSQQVPVLELS